MKREWNEKIEGCEMGHKLGPVDSKATPFNSGQDVKCCLKGNTISFSMFLIADDIVRLLLILRGIVEIPCFFHSDFVNLEIRFFSTRNAIQTVQFGVNEVPGRRNTNYYSMLF